MTHRQTVADLIPRLAERIARQFGPERIILFGSQARGEATDRSDIDLLVVMPRLRDHHAT